MWITSDNPVFFDTDCLSSFLAARRLKVLVDLFGDRIRVPAEVVRELEGLRYDPSSTYMLSSLMDFLRGNPQARVVIEVGGDIYAVYQRLKAESVARPLGAGEMAVMAHALQERGIVASNNLRDVKEFCLRYCLDLICTEHIIVGAVARNLISYGAAKKTWHHMRITGTRLPAYGLDGAWERLATRLQIAPTQDP